MNKQIRELAEQAREYATTRHPVSNIILSVNSDLFEQKFAELLIRECADVCQQFGNGGSGYTLSSEIREHFGVEE